MLIRIAVTCLAAVALSACGSAEEPNAEASVSAIADADGEGLFEDVPVIDMSSTELPAEWPSTIPVLEGSVIDNVIAMDDSITAVWIISRGDAFSLMDEYIAGLKAGGYAVGEAEASESFTRGSYSNETHTVEFDITPLTKTDWQIYVTYAPRDAA